jgi:hypothetical protein
MPVVYDDLRFLASLCRAALKGEFQANLAFSVEAEREARARERERPIVSPVDTPPDRVAAIAGPQRCRMGAVVRALPIFLASCKLRATGDGMPPNNKNRRKADDAYETPEHGNVGICNAPTRRRCAAVGVLIMARPPLLPRMHQRSSWARADSTWLLFPRSSSVL